VAAANATGAWFCALGETLNTGEQTSLQRYLQGLGAPQDISLHAVADWQTALRLTTDARWDASLWRAEQTERARLLQALATGGRAALASAAFEAISDRLHGCAALAAARMGCSEPGLIRAAAGAATEALYLSELARAADASAQHPFQCKIALFESGHWPLVLIENQYYIF